MELKRAWDVEDVDLPFIESPTVAKRKVDTWLRRGPGLGVDHYYRLTRSADIGDYVPEGEKIRRIANAVGNGDLLLVTNGVMDRPFCPLVAWDGQQWRAQSPGLSALRISSLVSAHLPRLNARALGPASVATLQRDGGWGVARPAPIPEPPAPSQEPIVPDQPEGCVFAKSCTVPEGTIDTGWMLEPASRFGNVAILGTTDAPTPASAGGPLPWDGWPEPSVRRERPGDSAVGHCAWPISPSRGPGPPW